MRDIKWETVKNPRKLNGDLGHLKCDWCGCQSGAYVKFSFGKLICRGCMDDGIKAINKAILDFNVRGVSALPS